MTYFYGDSTPTELRSNFLEALRDAIDFAVAVAGADERIATAEPRARARQAEADAEAGRLEHLARSVLAVLEAERGAPGAPTFALAAELAATVSERHHAVAAAITEQLGEDIRRIEAEALAARDRYLSALETYLLRRDPPDAATETRLVLVDREKEDDTYEAALVGRSDMGLRWSIELEIPPKTMWATPVRVDRVVDALEIHAPHLAGLIKKEVKRKKQKLSRHLVTSFVDDGTTVSLELRVELGGESGFDVSADLDARAVTAARIGAADDASVGPFEVEAGDVEGLLDLATKLRAGAREIPRKRLLSAIFDGAAFDGGSVQQPGLVAIVERLVAKLAPTVRKIAARSHTVDELVLRRMLADGRREELFLPKVTLRDVIAPLGEARRALFAPLGLDPGVDDAAPPAKVVDEPAVRVEVPPSVPPFVAAEEDAGPVVEVKGLLELVSEPPEAAPAEAAPAEAAPAESAPESAPPSSRDELVAAVKEIRALSHEGRADDAHRAFAALFASPAFAAARIEDQRQALKLMTLAKTPPTASEAMIEAYRAALGPLQALILEHREPADYEMLGATYALLDEPAKATEIFKKALEIERAKNPASDLCGNLMRRLSQV